MDVQNMDKNIVIDKATNGFRDALIRIIFKIKENKINHGIRR